MLRLHESQLHFLENETGENPDVVNYQRTRCEWRKHEMSLWKSNQGQSFVPSSVENQHYDGISGAQLRFKFRLYLPICKSLPMRNYLSYPKWMQDLENAGFKLFTQMHWGQQKGWKKYQSAGCCTVIHYSYGEIWNSLFLSSKWNPVLFFPLSHFCWQCSGFFY